MRSIPQNNAKKKETKEEKRASGFPIESGTPNQNAVDDVLDRYYQWLWKRDDALRRARAAGRGSVKSARVSLPKA